MADGSTDRQQDMLRDLDVAIMTRTQSERLALLAKRSKRSIEDVAELWEERAAIREFDGGKRRKEAEALALDDVADVVLR